MKLRYVSDLHLEINKHHAIPDFIVGIEGECLIVDGDTITACHLRKERNDEISRGLKKSFKKFLLQVADFDKIFFTLGNHEHYHGHFQLSAHLLRRFMHETCGLSPDKYIVLDNSSYDLDENTILVGATLWTNMRENHEDAHYFVGRGMNDFRLITYGDGFKIFSTYDARDEHYNTMDYLKFVVEANPDKRIIVATHHAPSYQSNGRDYSSSTIIDGYCSNLEGFIKDHKNITDWVHGHTHVNVEYMIGQARITSNMRGYVGYDYSAANFDAKTFLEKFITI